MIPGAPLLLLAACLWCLFLAVGCRDRLVANRWNAAIGAVLLGSLTVWHVARQTGASDRENYVHHLRLLNARDSISDVPFVDDPLYNLLAWVVAKTTDANEYVLYGVIATIVSVVYYTAARLLLPAWASLLAFLTVLSSGFFIAYASVGIRQGLAINILVLGVAMYASGGASRRALAVVLITASLFHWSAAPLGIALFAIRLWAPPLRLLGWVWIALVPVFAFQINRSLLSGVTPEVDAYASAAAFARYSGAGARLDFLAVSAAVLGAAAVARRWVPSGDASEVYDRLLAAYITFNSFFLLLGFVAFSDRIAAYSWFLAPLILWFVLSRRERVSSAHVTFTTVLVIGSGIVTGGLLALS